jgi:exodeoxyribonuclease VII large subunit
MPDGERPDVLIVARGGGSVEDLWAFNSEVLVRAVAGSGIVVISGVGHEPDVTLCDFAADVRAATPTAAAELAVPVRLDWLAELADTRERLARTMQQQVAQRRLRVQHLARLVPDPRRMVLQADLRMQELTERLRAVAPRVVGQRRLMLQSLTRVLGGLNPTAVLGRGFVYLTNAQGEVLPRATAPSGPVQVHFADGTRDAVLT